MPDKDPMNLTNIQNLIEEIDTLKEAQALLHQVFIEERWPAKDKIKIEVKSSTWYKILAYFGVDENE